MHSMQCGTFYLMIEINSSKYDACALKVAIPQLHPWMEKLLIKLVYFPVLELWCDTRLFYFLPLCAEILLHYILAEILSYIHYFRKE